MIEVPDGIFTAPCWAPTSMPSSLLHWGTQCWAQHPRCGLNSVQCNPWRSSLFSLSLSTLFPPKRSSTLLTRSRFWAQLSPVCLYKQQNTAPIPQFLAESHLARDIFIGAVQSAHRNAAACWFFFFFFFFLKSISFHVAPSEKGRRNANLLLEHGRLLKCRYFVREPLFPKVVPAAPPRAALCSAARAAFRRQPSKQARGTNAHKECLLRCLLPISSALTALTCPGALCHNGIAKFQLEMVVRGRTQTAPHLWVLTCS